MGIKGEFVIRPADRSLLDRLAGLLDELYDPPGTLIFWSSRISYLDHQRPCDLLVAADWEALAYLADRLNAICDGAFA